MSRLSLFETLDGVEVWVRLYGVQPLRDILHDSMLDERTTFLARQWLRRYDANLSLARAEGLVAPPIYALRARAAYPPL